MNNRRAITTGVIIGIMAVLIWIFMGVKLPSLVSDMLVFPLILAGLSLLIIIFFVNVHKGLNKKAHSYLSKRGITPVNAILMKLYVGPYRIKNPVLRGIYILILIILIATFLFLFFIFIIALLPI